jgi:hypothetical protein
MVYNEGLLKKGAAEEVISNDQAYWSTILSNCSKGTTCFNKFIKICLITKEDYTGVHRRCSEKNAPRIHAQRP